MDTPPIVYQRQLTMSNTTILPWVANRILAFFNAAGSVAEILDGTIQDDPTDGAGRTLGPTLAARILRERSQLPRLRFTEFSQLDAIAGIGEGALRDLVFSFGTPAAEAFQQSMYHNRVIYRENWPLEYFRTTIAEQQEFNDLVSDEAHFRRWVADRVSTLATERALAAPQREDMVAQLHTNYIDTYHNSTQAAALALALWFYEFDADNWFSWARILQETDAYLNHHQGGFPWYMELRFFRGFRNRGIIPPGITPPDLPVMVNWPEQSITLWFST
ncbi:MAG: hypothetical protein DA408_09390, partial [Bacteroidetes bacterium]